MENFFKETPGVYNKLESYNDADGWRRCFSWAFSYAKDFSFLIIYRTGTCRFTKQNEHVFPVCYTSSQGYTWMTNLRALSEALYFATATNIPFALT
jgi:hypothetical protein